MVANYSSRANKPDMTLQQRRLIQSVERLPNTSDFKKRLSSRAYAIMGSEEVRVSPCVPASI